MVEEDPRNERLVVHEGAAVAELRYHRSGDRFSILHTGAPEAIAGRGIGGQLVRAAVERASTEGLVVPYCAYAWDWLESHPDVAAAVDVDWP